MGHENRRLDWNRNEDERAHRRRYELERRERREREVEDEERRELEEIERREAMERREIEEMERQELEELERREALERREIEAMERKELEEIERREAVERREIEAMEQREREEHARVESNRETQHQGRGRWRLHREGLADMVPKDENRFGGGRRFRSPRLSGPQQDPLEEELSVPSPSNLPTAQPRSPQPRSAARSDIAQPTSLDLELVGPRAPVEVNQPIKYRLRVSNPAAEPDNNISIRFNDPAGVHVAGVTQLSEPQKPHPIHPRDGWIYLQDIRSLRPHETIEFAIVLTGEQAKRFDLRAEAVSVKMRDGAASQVRTAVIPGR